MFHPRFWLLALMIFVPAALRVVDHPWNFAPVGALALFAGAHFRSRAWAFAMPLGAMFLSDVALGIVRNNMSRNTFHDLLPVVYGSFAVSVCLGFAVRRHWDRFAETRDERPPGSDDPPDSFWQTVHDQLLHRVLPVAGAGFAGAVIFFVFTNFGEWLLRYPLTWAGLVECYWLAAPFFRNTLASDAVYIAVLFGGYGLVQLCWPVFRESRELIFEERVS